MKGANLPAGVILAGGRSRRMQGQTKALVALHGKPLMQHVIDRLQPQVTSLAISVDQENPAFEFFGLPQVTDPRRGSRGPLGGVLAALNALEPGCDLLLLVPCDAPFLPLELGQRLMERLTGSGQAACVVRYEGELQPTFSLWSRRLQPELRRAVLDDGLGGFKQFFDRVPVSVLDWAPAAASPFFNVNTRKDLERAHLLLEANLIATGTAPT